MATSSPAWYAMFAVGQIPAGISNCYKQKCLKGVDLEVMCERPRRRRHSSNCRVGRARAALLRA